MTSDLVTIVCTNCRYITRTQEDDIIKRCREWSWPCQRCKHTCTHTKLPVSDQKA